MDRQPPRVRRQSIRATTSNDVSAAPIAPAPSATEPVQPSQMPTIEPAEPTPQATIPDPIEEKPMIVETQTAKPAPPKRSKLGYAIRDDLIKQCKQIALDEDRFVYDVVEELLEEGIERRRRNLEK